MKLTSITARNFKGLNFSLDLADLTILVGKNFAGKTARLDAIRFLLLGYLPELGKVNKATFQLASGTTMSVEGNFSDGTKAVRALRLKGDSIKAEFVGPDWMESPNLAVMLDPQVYFAMSDRDRVTYVAGMVKGTNPTQLPAGSQTPGGTPFLIQQGETDVAYLERLITEWVSREKYTKAFAKTMQETTTGIASLKTLEGPGEPGNLAELGTERHALANEIMSIGGGIAKLEEQIEQQEKRQSRWAFLNNQIALAGPAQTQLERYRVNLAEDEKQLQALGADVDDISVPTLALDRAQREVNSLVKTIADENELIRLGRQNLVDLESTEVCPYCGAKGKGWRDISAADIKGKIAKSQGVIGQCNHNLVVAKTEMEKAGQALTKAKQNRTRAEVLRAAIKAHGKQVGVYEKTLGQLPAWKAELEQITAPDTTLPAALQSARESHATKEHALSQLDAKIAGFQGRANDQKRLAESEIQRDRAVADREAATAVLAELRKIQGEIVQKAFEPLLVAANGLFGGILKTPLAYHNGEIGRWEGALWVSHATFSGTEKALAYAAIQAALTQQSPFRIMLLDELGRVDDENKTRLISRSAKAIILNQIDQFLGVDVSSESVYHNAVVGDCTTAIHAL